MELNIEKPIEKVVSKIDSWLESLVSLLPNMAVSVLILILFILLAKLSKKVTQNLFSKTSDNQVLSDLFGTIMRYTVIGLGLFIVMSVLGLEKAVTSLLAGVGIVGIALGFAFQDISANFISGILLAFKTPFRLGDVVELNGIMGTVEKTTIRVTTLKTFQGQVVYLPNKDVLQNPIYNYTELGKRRIDLSIGVSYSDNLQVVEKLVCKTIKEMKGVIDPENVIFDYYEFGSSSINFNIRFWIDFPGPDDLGFLQVKNNAIKAIKNAFDQNEITIPFPIRTLDLPKDTKENIRKLYVHSNGQTVSNQQ